MLNLKVLINILKPETMKKTLYILLFLCLIPILDCILIINLAQLLGKYLFLAIIVFFSLIGFFFSQKMIEKVLNQIQLNLKNNIMSEKDYYFLPGSFSVSFLLIMPGIISTFIGLFTVIPGIRTNIGLKISEYLKIDWKEIHEYLNIID